MTAIVRNESRGLMRGSVLMAGLLAVTVAFLLLVFPSIKAEAETVIDAYPAFMLNLLGIEELHTIEGFAAGYVIPFGLTLLGGVYLAYVASSMVVDDVRTRRMDLLLANPVSRESVVLQKFGALWVPTAALVGVVLVVVSVGAAAVGEPIDVGRLVLALAWAVPYLLVCGSLGLLLSVILDRVNAAQAGAIGVVFVLYLLEGLSGMDPAYDVLGWIAPSRYYDPNAALLRGEVAVADVAILVAAGVGLVGVAVVVFARKDL
ncbi:MAG: ABC transporter permease subunit [Halobacteriota archaeon]